ncbi:MAG: hypothetical protein JWM53_2731 [bacterium]|nr:hypothetical protein [bacterium]
MYMHWVFDQSQLDRALEAYTARRAQEGVSQAKCDAIQIRAFLSSPEAEKLTVTSTPKS